ncbi:MAG: alpha/beta hydrolase, partial [Gammaproteobacteria bacterium]|nr:alpha/beta hydrolase [Gammaproteobacteria bacterium]
MTVSGAVIWKTKMLNAVFSILAFVVLLNIIMFFFQPAMLFIPYGKIDATPAQWGLEYEDVFFQTGDDIQLHGWYIPNRNAKRTLLFFHGNAGNISHRGESIKIFHRMGLNVFIPDYRGYGKSEGKPSETGLYEDARSAWHYLLTQKDLQRDNIIIFGRSMGGAVAIKLAADVQPGALILESVFSSINDMAKSIMPGLSRLLVLRFNFDNKAMIKQVYSPLLLMHSPDDEIIPFEQGKKVFLAANNPKKLIQLRGDHNSGFLQSQPDYEGHIENFIQSLK